MEIRVEEVGKQQPRLLQKNNVSNISVLQLPHSFRCFSALCLHSEVGQ